MKRSLAMGAISAGRSLRVLVTSAALLVVLAVTIAVISPSAALAAKSVRQGDVTNLFYTTSGAGTGLPYGAEIFAITVRGATVTTRDIGPTHGGDCGSLALSPAGIAGIEALLARPLAEARDAGLAERSTRDALTVITAAYEYFGNFRLRTLRTA